MNAPNLERRNQDHTSIVDLPAGVAPRPSSRGPGERGKIWRELIAGTRSRRTPGGQDHEFPGGGYNRVASPSSSPSRPGGNGGGTKWSRLTEETSTGLVVSNRRPSRTATAYIPYSCIPCMRSVHVLYSLSCSTGVRARLFIRRKLYVGAHTAVRDVGVSDILAKGCLPHFTFNKDESAQPSLLYPCALIIIATDPPGDVGTRTRHMRLGVWGVVSGEQVSESNRVLGTWNQHGDKKEKRV